MASQEIIDFLRRYYGGLERRKTISGQVLYAPRTETPDKRVEVEFKLPKPIKTPSGRIMRSMRYVRTSSRALVPISALQLDDLSRKYYRIYERYYKPRGLAYPEELLPWWLKPKKKGWL